MEELGAGVLRRACAACASWPDDISVSVNLSPSQFRNGNIEKAIADALQSANLSPERLDIEITESTLLDNRRDARGTLDALRSRGLRVSLDDFGTGYSSLSYLLSFPLDRIKIDRSFTIGLGIQERASILVESVAAMSRKLGMTVLIEGVETERQMRIIETLGTIAEVQGFLFSPPVPQSARPGPARPRKRQEGRGLTPYPPFSAPISDSASAESQLAAPATTPISQPSLSISIVTGRPSALPFWRRVSNASPLGSA